MPIERRIARYVHVDPCEEAYDTPRMYEVGWKKTLTYVFAFFPEEAVDVVARYAKAPRREVSETFVAGLMASEDGVLGSQLSVGRREVMAARRVAETMSFGHTKEVASVGPLGGRTTGSLEWRAGRGETGTGDDAMM